MTKCERAMEIAPFAPGHRQVSAAEG